METTVISTILAVAAPGQAITKSTTMSVALVLIIIAATVTMTTYLNTMGNDIFNLKEDISEIRANQDEILNIVNKL